MNKPVIKFKKLHPDAIIPAYAKPGDSGFDLCAIEDVEIRPGETKLVRTGLACELPEGFELQVRPRSGMSLKTPLHIRNAPGTVDNGYRGELGVICHCLHMQEYDNGGLGVPMFDYDDERPDVIIKKGDRIAQAVVAPVAYCDIKETYELTETERGEGGYGSTGVKGKPYVVPSEDEILDPDGN